MLSTRKRASLTAALFAVLVLCIVHLGPEVSPRTLHKLSSGFAVANPSAKHDVRGSGRTSWWIQQEGIRRKLALIEREIAAEIQESRKRFMDWDTSGSRVTSIRSPVQSSFSQSRESHGFGHQRIKGGIDEIIGTTRRLRGNETQDVIIIETNETQEAEQRDQHEALIQQNIDMIKREIAEENERHQAKLKALEKNLSYWKELTDGDEEDDVEASLRRQSIRWSAGSIFCAAVLACCCVCCQGACMVWCVCASPFSMMSEAFSTNVAYAALATYDGAAADAAEIARVVRFEMRLMVIYTIIPWLAFSSTSCDGGAPDWIYYIYLPLLLRAKFIEFRLLSRLGKTSLACSLGFILGIMEHADYFTDGIFPIQAIKCDPEATELFVQSFAQSKVDFLTPLVAAIKFWGLSLVSLLAVVLSQQALGVAQLSLRRGGDLAILAEIPGFGALATHFDESDGESTYFLAVVRVLVENCAQLWLQSSYFGLVFDRVSDVAKGKLLLSMGLGLLSATYKAICSVKAPLRALSGNGVCTTSVLLMFPCAMVCMVLWIAAKIFFAFHYADHIWNITSGCVQVG